MIDLECVRFADSISVIRPVLPLTEGVQSLESICFGARGAVGACLRRIIIRYITAGLFVRIVLRQ